MNIQKCANGHYYNVDKFSECPHCNPNAGRKEPAGSAVGSSGEDTGKNRGGETIGINWGPASKNNTPKPEPKEEPVRHSGGRSENTNDVNTESIFRRKIDEPRRCEEPASYPYPDDEPSGGNSLEDEIKRANNTPDEGKTQGFFQMFTYTASADNNKPSVPVQHISSEPVAGWLVCVGGAHFGESFSVFGKKNSVGRNNSNSIVIPGDTTVSREKHAFVTYDTKGKRFYLEPGGANVYLNENLVMTPQEIHIYDVIELGDGNARFVFVPLCGSSFDWKDYIK